MAGGEAGDSLLPERDPEWLHSEICGSGGPTESRQWREDSCSVPSAAPPVEIAGYLEAPPQGFVSSNEGRPTDDAILRQENEIKAEIAGKLEYVGDKEPLQVLAAEYQPGSVFRAKIQRLADKYEGIRRARGDGNCFFRSFMFSYLERILETKDEAEAQRMLARLPYCRKLLISAGYLEFTWEDFMTVFSEQIESVRPMLETTISLDTLVQRCRDSGVSDYVVMFFRFVTSCEIQHRAEFFEPFVFGTSDMSVIKFCRTCVEPMGEESDHIHITALIDVLQVPVRVVYLDGSLSGNDAETADVNHHDFIPGESDGSASVVQEIKEPFAVLLYRPGHYDILYPKKLSSEQIELQKVL